MRRPALWLLCVAVSLAGCGKHDAAPPAKPAAAPTTAPEPAPVPAKPAPAASTRAAAPSDAFRLTGLALGSAIDGSYAVREPASFFAADTRTLYASVASDGRTAKATLGVRWRYLEGQGVLVNELSQDIATSGPAHTAFRVDNPDRWPAGKYRVDILLDGKPVLQQAFVVTGR